MGGCVIIALRLSSVAANLPVHFFDFCDLWLPTPTERQGCQKDPDRAPKTSSAISLDSAQLCEDCMTKGLTVVDVSVGG